jgi:hypothetical protein
MDSEVRAVVIVQQVLHQAKFEHGIPENLPLGSEGDFMGRFGKLVVVLC